MGSWAKKLVDYVVFDGAVSQDRIRELYAQADIFVLPSFAEGVPVVLMEAMAQEIACVTTGITGHPELIATGIDGILVPPSDVDGLVDAIAGLMADPALRRQLGPGGAGSGSSKPIICRKTSRPWGRSSKPRWSRQADEGSPAQPPGCFRCDCLLQYLRLAAGMPRDALSKGGRGRI